MGKIRKDFVSLLPQHDVVRALAREGAELVGSAQEQADARQMREVILWTKVIKEAGVKAE